MLQQKRDKSESKIREWVKLLDLSNEEKRLLRVIRALLYQKAREDLLLSILEFVLLGFFREIAKKRKISLDQAERLTMAETIDVLGGKPVDVGELNERKKAALIVQFNDGQIVVSGEEAVALHKKIIKDVAPKKFSGTLKGQTGHPGLVRGRVRLIHHITHLKQLESGEILVTAATNPAFIIAMKKAAAIVTDEGGLTCHAAIISREMGKPCVVGTKYATQFFRTGDLVEVNATKGIVKKLGK